MSPERADPGLAGTGLESIWGDTVVEADYAGHRGLVFEPRPRGWLDLLSPVPRFADRCFIVQGDRRISFGSFLAAIEPAAAILAGHGLRSGDHVLLHAYNSPDWALALFAAWRLGAVPVLGNRWWSPAELEHAAWLSRPALVISDDPSATGPTGLAPAALAGAFSAGASSAGAGRDPMAAVTGFPVAGEGRPAVVIFTSGSSGPAKGVVLSHRSVLANQHNLLVRSRRLPRDLTAAELEASPRHVALTCTPFFHIGGLSNLIANLLTGTTVVLNQGRFDAGQVLRLIEAERVDTFGGVPTMALRVLEHPDFESADLSSLRSWPLGGAPVPGPLLERMSRQVPQLARRGLGNTWGMSESGGFLTGAGNRDLTGHPGTVGRPYPTAELRIDDPDGTGTGEIMARSPTVMLGYLGPSGPDRAGIVDGGGWLHTGDLGHLDADGYLYLDGRSKDIVIRGGENIACAQVELALTRHPAVTEVAVLGLPHPDLGEELAAVVVHRAGRPPTAAELREFLAGQLAYFAIPTRWLLRTEPLPTLAGEKTDRKGLPALFGEDG